MKSLIHKRVELARKGENQKVISRVNSGWVVMGDVQFLRGYCLLLPDPVVGSLNDLSRDKREEYLYEMSVIGDSLIEVTGCHRVNYEILGNTEQALHAHIFPRYKYEKKERYKMPAWFYDWKSAPQFKLEEYADLMNSIRIFLLEKGIVQS